MKKNILSKYLISILFCIPMLGETIELSDLVGITFEEINNQKIVTYNSKTNELNRFYYYIKNNQLYKSKEATLYPKNDLNFKNYRLQQYKNELKKIGCKNYKAKECINSFPFSSYFEYDGERVYILKKNQSKIYNIIKYNYNKFIH